MCQGIEMIQNYKKKNVEENVEINKDKTDQFEKMNENENDN
jgi:hypothetical protein